ncbi:OmpP1/FadL family transporter [Rufibacter immobilis]|uniref:OmpP1/FadL family transporter n=1 Tax=Rufibacter immobilis TaxID=1348778 RepID=UPI0035EFEC6C
MKRYSFLLACLALLGSAGKGFAQNEVDALRYSRTDFGGTARTMGLGGANVALGGDAGSFSSNPAGLGLFRRSEITVSAGFNANEVNSTVYGSQAMNSRNNLNIPGFSAVFTTRKADDEEGDWRSSTFGIGYTRQNNFNQRSFYRATGQLENLKFGEYAAQLANGDPHVNGELTYNTLQELAYKTYLISPEDDGYYISPNLVASNVFEENMQSSGSQNQWDFAYGASFRDKLFLGASIGLTTVRFKQTRTYVEESPATDINSLTLRDELRTEGTGVSLRVGAIYKPSDALRLGFSVQTPTWYNLTDRFDTNLAVNFNQAPEEGASVNQFFAADPGEYEYNLTTPFRASGGAAVFIGKNGFITADVEYVDYSNARLNADDSFNSENQTIRNVYDKALNFRVGAEARLDIFRVRAGFAQHGDPFKNSDVDQAKTFLTGGLGIRQSNFFIDAALVYSKYNSVYSPYTNLEFDNPASEFYQISAPSVKNKHENTNFVATVGWNF